MPVGVMLTQMSSWELTAWLAYFQVAEEKRGEEADRQKFAQSIGA